MSNQPGNSKDLAAASPAQHPRHNAAQNVPQDVPVRVKSFKPGRPWHKIPKEQWSCCMCGLQAQPSDTLKEVKVTLGSSSGKVRSLRFVNQCYDSWMGQVTFF